MLQQVLRLKARRSFLGVGCVGNEKGRRCAIIYIHHNINLLCDAPETEHSPLHHSGEKNQLARIPKVHG